jgi:thiol-disulfide isomerase/thioredoxin
MRSLRPLAPPRAWLLCLLMLALAGCERHAPAPAPALAAPAPMLAAGQAFPSFMLDFLARGDARHALRGKMLVLNVWASWCPPCRDEMPALDHLSKTLDPRRFAVVGLSTDDDARLATEFLQQHAIGFPNFLDEGGAMSRRLGLDAYPETFVIAADGTLVQRMTGWHDWGSADMRARLERLYQAQPHSAAPREGL